MPSVASSQNWGSSEHQVLLLGYVWTRSCGSAQQGWRSPSISRVPVQGRGNSSANALKRPTGAAVSYQAQQTYFVGNCWVHVQNFHKRLVAKKLKLDLQQKISAPSFTLDKITSYKFISTPFRKFYNKPVVDGWVFRCVWFTCVLLIYFSYYFTLSINSKVVCIVINSKSSGLNLYTSSKLLILDLK